MKTVLCLFLFIALTLSHETTTESKVHYTSSNAKACLYTRECPKDQYCSGNPEKKIHGNCEKRYEGFCQGSHQCEHSKSMACLLTTCKKKKKKYSQTFLY